MQPGSEENALMLCCEPGCNDERAWVRLPVWPWAAQVLRKCGRGDSQSLPGDVTEYSSPFDIWLNEQNMGICVWGHYQAWIGSVAINGKKKQKAPSGAKLDNFLCQQISNRWRRVLLEETDYGARPSPEHPLRANHYSPCISVSCQPRSLVCANMWCFDI